MTNDTKREFGPCVNTDIGISDCHNIVGCCFNADFKKPGKKCVHYRNYTRFDLDKFKESLEQIIFDDYILHEDVNKQMGDIHEIFFNVIRNKLPKNKGC